MTYGYSDKCRECLKGEIKDDVLRFGGYKGSNNVSGIFYDEKTGRQVAVTESGKKIDVAETKYDPKNDPRGWKAQNKKYRETDSHGKRNNR